VVCVGASRAGEIPAKVYPVDFTNQRRKIVAELYVIEDLK